MTLTLRLRETNTVTKLISEHHTKMFDAFPFEHNAATPEQLEEHRNKYLFGMNVKVYSDDILLADYAVNDCFPSTTYFSNEWNYKDTSERIMKIRYHDAYSNIPE